MRSVHEIGWMGWIAVGSAALAAVILVGYLLKRSTLAQDSGRNIKLWLLFGLGVFPLTSAGAANIEGFKATQSRTFCGSCHVMQPHSGDSEDPSSRSLAAIHARNHAFGEDNCYTCHKDYGMYGYVLTKAGGMRHVYLYLTEFRSVPLEEAKRSIRIRAPVPNENCMYCHTTTAPRWQSIPDHVATLAAVRQGTIGCASPGCHGFAHPMTKTGPEVDHAKAPAFDGGVR